jgi:hypothetical protein
VARTCLVVIRVTIPSTICPTSITTSCPSPCTNASLRETVVPSQCPLLPPPHLLCRLAARHPEKGRLTRACLLHLQSPSGTDEAELLWILAFLS